MVVSIKKRIGPKQDHIAAREFILKVYSTQLPDTDRMYPHFTCATGQLLIHRNDGGPVHQQI